MVWWHAIFTHMYVMQIPTYDRISVGPYHPLFIISCLQALTILTHVAIRHVLRKPFVFIMEKTCFCNTNN
jgi:hypothetical protein